MHLATPIFGCVKTINQFCLINIVHNDMKKIFKACHKQHNTINLQPLRQAIKYESFNAYMYYLKHYRAYSFSYKS